MLLAVLALLVRYAHVAIPVLSNYSFETLLVAFLLLLAGNMFRGFSAGISRLSPSPTDCHQTVTIVTLDSHARFERHPNSPGFSDEPGLFSLQTWVLRRWEK